MIRIFVVDDSPVALQNIKATLVSLRDVEVCGTAADGESALAQIKTAEPQLVLMDTELPGIDGIRATELMVQQDPTLKVIVMGIDDDPQTIALAKRAGAAEYIIKPFTIEELSSMVRRLTSSETIAPAPAPFAPLPPLEVPTYSSLEQDAKVISVTAAKGGVGASTMTANLAVLIAHETKRNVVVVDLDLQRGDIGELLRVESRYNIGNLAAATPEESADAVIAPSPHGVSAIIAPQGLSWSGRLTAHHVQNLIPQLSAKFDTVIFDVPSYFDPAGVTALQYSERIVIIGGMSHPAIRGTGELYSLLGDMQVPEEVPLLVLNRCEANSDFTKEAVEKMIGRQAAVQLPYDPIVISSSINRGTPFVLTSPSSPASRRLREIAAHLVALSSSVEFEPHQGDSPLPKLRNTKRGGKNKRKLFGFAK